MMSEDDGQSSLSERRVRRVLMVCYYYPPLGGIGSIRATRFAQYLPAFGWDPLVLAPSNGAYYRDESIPFDASRVQRAYSLELSRLGKRMTRAGGSDTEPARPRAWTNKLRELMRRHVYWPDAQIGWYPFAVRAGLRLLRRQRFDAIFSSAYPITCHLIAERLHARHGTPWVAEFRDPWADAAGCDQATRQRRLLLETRLVRSADAVVTVSPSWETMLKERGAGLTAVITNGYDPADMPPPLPSSDLVFTHLGSLYPHMQDLSQAWTALAELRRLQPNRRVRVRFVGEVSPVVLQQLEAAGISGCVEITGFLSHREALAQISASTALLLGGPSDTHRAMAGWIPAKIFEYLATGLPIIYIGNLAGDAAELLRDEPFCFCCDRDDTAGIRRAFEQVADGPRVHRNLEAFTRRALTQRLAFVLNRVVDRPSATMP